MFRFSGLGCAFAAGVLFFTGVGWVLDGRLGWFPVLTIAGTLLGTALSTLSVWRSLEVGVSDTHGEPGEDES